jgi:hypothetical protein
MQIKIVLNHEEQKKLVRLLSENTSLNTNKFQSFVSFFKIDITLDILVIGDEIKISLPIDSFSMTVKRDSPDFIAVKNFIFDSI